jgi:hypothetical protein
MRRVLKAILQEGHKLRFRRGRPIRIRQIYRKG